MLISSTTSVARASQYAVNRSLSSSTATSQVQSEPQDSFTRSPMNSVPVGLGMVSSAVQQVGEGLITGAHVMVGGVVGGALGGIIGELVGGAPGAIIGGLAGGLGGGFLGHRSAKSLL